MSQGHKVALLAQHDSLGKVLLDHVIVDELESVLGKTPTERIASGRFVY